MRNLERFAARMHERSFLAGAGVFTDEQPDRAVYMLLKGSVKVYTILPEPPTRTALHPRPLLREGTFPALRCAGPHDRQRKLRRIPGAREPHTRRGARCTRACEIGDSPNG